MAVDVARTGSGKVSGFAGISEFFRTLPANYRDMMGELKRVTWPDRAQTLDATWRIIVFVLLLGLVIWLMDLVLQGILVRSVQALFGGARG